MRANKIKYMNSMWEGQKICQKWYKTPNLWKVDLPREKIRSFQLKILSQDAKFIVEVDSCVLSKNGVLVFGRLFQVES